MRRNWKRADFEFVRKIDFFCNICEKQMSILHQFWIFTAESDQGSKKYFLTQEEAEQYQKDNGQTKTVYKFVAIQDDEEIGSTKFWRIVDYPITLHTTAKRDVAPVFKYVETE